MTEKRKKTLLKKAESLQYSVGYALQKACLKDWFDYNADMLRDIQKWIDSVVSLIEKLEVDE